MPKEQVEWIDPLSDLAVAYAAEKWGLAPLFTRQMIEKAINDELLSARLPQTEFMEYVQLLIPQQLPLPSRLPPVQPVKKDRFTWLWVVIICAGIWGLSLFTPGNTETFLFGLAAFLVSLYILYHNYATNTVRTNFRAGCYLWLFLFAGLGLMIVGLDEMFHPS